MTDTCKDCKHFCSAGSVGECRHNPPVILLDKRPITVWPLVGAEDWCGKFAAK